MNLSVPLHIGFFVETHQPGVGLFHIIDPIARHLMQKVKVTLFTTTLKDKSLDDDYPYTVVRHHTYRIPLIDLELPFHFLDFKFNRMLKEAQLDVVHLHSGHTMGKIGARHAHDTHVPLLGSLHGMFTLNAWNPVMMRRVTEKQLIEMKTTFSMCDLLFATHPVIKETYDQSEQHQKPILFPLGTDINELAKEAMIQDLRLKHAIKSDEKVFVSVCTSYVPAELEGIADVLFKLRLKGFKFRWILINASLGSEALNVRIKKNGLSPFVIYTDQHLSSETYASYLKLADLILHASSNDVSNQMIIDAASQRKVVVCMEETPLSKQITDGINGFIAKPMPTMFAERIIEILKYPKVIQKAGDKAYQDFYRTWEEMTALLMEAYLHAMKQT